MLESIIKDIQRLPLEVMEELLPHFEYIEYPKNFQLLRQGEQCRKIWLIQKGIARYYHIDEKGRDRTVWFSFEKDFIADAPSLLEQKVSYESIELLEDSELYYIDFSKVRALLEKRHSFALWYIKILETVYIPQLEDRIADLQFLSARERYTKLQEEFPQLGNRVNLGYIASFLNITQETLSRIRAQR